MKLKFLTHFRPAEFAPFRLQYVGAADPHDIPASASNPGQSGTDADAHKNPANIIGCQS